MNLEMIGLRFALMLQGISMPSLKREEGQTLAEYALILALIAALVAAALTVLQKQINSLFTSIADQL